MRTASLLCTLPAVALLASLAACVVAPNDDEGLSEAAGALGAVSNFGSNPGALQMYLYAPSAMPKDAPLVVAMHGCAQGATDYQNTGWSALADAKKFYVVYPQQTSSNNGMKCFTWYADGDIKRGAGEAASIKQMVDWAKANYSIDASRVYVTGLSAGGGMTEVMLATYPDVFAAGAVFSGLPYGCAHTMNESSGCMNGPKNLSASSWASAVRAGYPSWTGPWPRVSVWHGTSDYTVVEANAAESVLQWTAVHGLSSTATSTATIGKATRTLYQDGSGRALVERWSISGMGHGTPVDPKNGCGAAGAFVLDVGLCSTQLAWSFFEGSASSGGGDAGTTDTGTTPADTGTTPTTDSGTAPSDTGTTPTTDSGTAPADTGTTPTTDSGTTPADTGTTPSDAGTPSWTCRAFTSTNVAHVTAGRAARCGTGGSYVCARGSGKQFGLWVMTTSTLRESAAGYFEPGACP